MSGKEVHILSTKLLDEAIIKQAASYGIIIECIPFIHIKTKEKAELIQPVADAIGTNNYLVFTSANAVYAVADLLNDGGDFLVFCISGKTKKAVETLIPGAVIIADAPNGAELAEKIVAAGIKRAAFFCGDRRLNTIPDKLSAGGIGLSEVVVYETSLTPQRIEKAYDGLLFFSPSSVESFFSINFVEESVRLFSFAGSTVKKLHSINKKAMISHTPSEQSMFEIVRDHFKR